MAGGLPWAPGDVSSRDHRGGPSTERGIPLPYCPLALCRVDLGQELLDGYRRVRCAGRAQHVESVLGKRQLGVHDGLPTDFP